MAGAKKRINSTGRRRINRESIDIRLLATALGQPLQAKASLDIAALGFPGNAAVAIEAYHRSSSMRFDCGTIDALAIPVMVLDQIDQGGNILFRVKVVDKVNEQGKLLGSAERIQPRSDDADEARRPLFPVQYRDLGAEVWKVDIVHGAKPTLIINSRMTGFSHRLQENPLVQGLLLPAALRIVLKRITDGGETGDEDDDEGGWVDDWLKYCKTEFGAEDPAGLDEEQKYEWTEDIIKQFCEQKSFIKRIMKMEEQHG